MKLSITLKILLMVKVPHMLIRWKSKFSAEELTSKELVGYSICRSNGRPSFFQLWFEQNIGIEFSSEPVEVDGRTEAGVIVVSDAKARNCSTSRIQANQWLASRRSVNLLVHYNAGIAVGSGLKIENDAGNLTIVSGIMPYSLALCGDVASEKKDFEPEYDLEHYSVEPIAGLLSKK